MTHNHFAYILLLFIFSSQKINAQEQEDVVYLKNGSVIHGEILEQNPGESVKIRSASRDIFVYKMEDVTEIKKEPTPSSKKNFDIKEKGYQSVINASLLTGNNQYYTVTSLSLTNVQGYQFKSGLALGIGSGIEWFNTTVIPVFADVSYYPLKKRKTPYVSLQAGYSAPLNPNNGSDLGWDGGYYGSKYTGGALFSASIGTRRYFRNGYSMLLGLGYRYQKLEYTNIYDWNGTTRVQTELLNRISFKMGFILS